MVMRSSARTVRHRRAGGRCRGPGARESVICLARGQVRLEFCASRPCRRRGRRRKGGRMFVSPRKAGQEAFLPEEFVVPTLVAGPRFQIRPITVSDVVKDYGAVI